MEHIIKEIKQNLKMVSNTSKPQLIVKVFDAFETVIQVKDKVEGIQLMNRIKVHFRCLAKYNNGGQFYKTDGGYLY